MQGALSPAAPLQQTIEPGWPELSSLIFKKFCPLVEKRLEMMVDNGEYRRGFLIITNHTTVQKPRAFPVYPPHSRSVDQIIGREDKFELLIELSGRNSQFCGVNQNLKSADIRPSALIALKSRCWVTDTHNTSSKKASTTALSKEISPNVISHS